MRATTNALATSVAAERTAAGFTRYSNELREALIAGAEAARESGTGVTAFAAATGVSAPSLFGWLRERQSFVRVRTSERSAPRRVATAAPVSQSTLTVTDMTSGVQVEGCTLTQAVELMRALRG